MVLIKCTTSFSLIGSHKDIMLEMAEYVPNIQKRASIERDYLKNKTGISVKSEKANTFIWFCNNEISDILVKNNLPKDWLEFCIANEPFKNLIISLTVNKDKGKRYIRFCETFRKLFERKDNSKNGDYMQIYSQTLISSNKTSGYLTEEDFQANIPIKLNDFFENKQSDYFKIIDFIINYDFDENK
ncbi:MAG: hypothetical protein ACI4PF_05280, partial [Christensenellales bacterium]